MIVGVYLGAKVTMLPFFNQNQTSKKYLVVKSCKKDETQIKSFLNLVLLYLLLQLFGLYI